MWLGSNIYFLFFSALPLLSMATHHLTYAALVDFALQTNNNGRKIQLKYPNYRMSMNLRRQLFRITTGRPNQILFETFGALLVRCSSLWGLTKPFVAHTKYIDHVCVHSVRVCVSLYNVVRQMSSNMESNSRLRHIQIAIKSV